MHFLVFYNICILYILSCATLQHKALEYMHTMCGWAINQLTKTGTYYRNIDAVKGLLIHKIALMLPQGCTDWNVRAINFTYHPGTSYERI